MFTQIFLSLFLLKPSKMAGGVTQVVEQLPTKCEALSSNPNSAKKSTMLN
jgi:hypothetical protein